MFPAPDSTIDLKKLFTPQLPIIEQPWHKEVTDDLRSQQLVKYVTAICQVLGSDPVPDRVLVLVAWCARIAEGSAFDSADDQVWTFCAFHCGYSLTNTLRRGRN
ncbi:unnamed protein product [Gongylonema pulchrum]|uniref:Phage protein n=1 Tax=Gongylonema pulchrum TaxID=637853 RepID=A0A183D968_9BILA|nr:unnamed protein product [Gongylonema pulchrum]